MRRAISILIAASLTLLAVFIVSAQDDDVSLGDQLPITADTRYQVGVGDTLDSIAALFDVSLECLIDTNEIVTPARIFPGDVLMVRVACPPYDGLDFVAFPRPVEDLGVGGGGSAYVVRAGDTLDEIAFAFDVSTEALQEFNDIVDPLALQPGEILQIPEDAPPYDGVIEQGGVAPNFEGEDGITYTIRPRDTLDTIGAFYDANPACIAEVNNITQPRLIQPRTVIFIPESCAPYTGPNNATGRILPMDAANTETPVPTVAQPTNTPTEAEPEPTEGPTQIMVPTITPTQEVLPTQEPTDEVQVTVLAITPTFTPAATSTATPTDEATEEATDAVTEPTATSTIPPTPTAELLDEDTEEGGGGGTGNLIDVLEGLQVGS